MKGKTLTTWARRALAAALTAAALGAAACNTVEGVGQDVSAAGKAVEDAADDAKN